MTVQAFLAFERRSCYRIGCLLLIKQIVCIRESSSLEVAGWQLDCKRGRGGSFSCYSFISCYWPFLNQVVSLLRERKGCLRLSLGVLSPGGRSGRRCFCSYRIPCFRSQWNTVKGAWRRGDWLLFHDGKNSLISQPSQQTCQLIRVFYGYGKRSVLLDFLTVLPYPYYSRLIRHYRSNKQ